MKEVRYFYAPQATQTDELPAEEAVHAIRVLRMQSGDELFLIDGQGAFYRAELTLVTNKRCLYRIQETMPQTKTWHGRLHIGMAPTKMMERTEWFVEKATEVGIDEFSFLNCQFSERKVLKTERLEKIAVAAMKQSRKAWKPQLSGPVAFHQLVSHPPEGHKFIAHCYEEIPKVDLFGQLQQLVQQEPEPRVTVLIGPEGDFSIGEVREALAAGFISVTLGSSRLRTETAALAATMMGHLALTR